MQNSAQRPASQVLDVCAFSMALAGAVIWPLACAASLVMPTNVARAVLAVVFVAVFVAGCGMVRGEAR